VASSVALEASPVVGPPRRSRFALSRKRLIVCESASYFVHMKIVSIFTELGAEEWVPNCAMIIGKPNDLVRQIHTRTPVILLMDIRYSVG
jgi:putative SOS response-associated peptidase YedK